MANRFANLSMKRRFRHLSLLCVLSFLLAFSNSGSVQAAASGLYTNAFYAIDSYNQLGYTEYADQIALGWSEIRNENGNIYFSQHKYGDKPTLKYDYGIPKGDIVSLIRQMKSQGNKLMLSVFLVDKPDSGNMLRKILDSKELQMKIIQDMVNALQVIKEYDYSSTRNASGAFPSRDVTDIQGRAIGYDGLIIDFEQLFNTYEDAPGISYRDKFTAFLKKLKGNMPAGKTLSVTLPPKRQLGIRYPDGYDYKQIGQIADEVILMAHDYQWKDGSIKATAPYKLVKEALEFAVKDIPREKILLQVSLGPVQWQNGTIYRPTYDSMLNALNGANENEKVIVSTPAENRFDSNLKVGYAYLKRERYKDGVLQDTVEDEFYFENSLSIAYKQHLAMEYGIKGMSLWYLGINAKEALEQFFQINVSVPTGGSTAMPDEALYKEIMPSGSNTVSGSKKWRITFNVPVDPRTVGQGIEVWKKQGSTWVRFNVTPVVDSNDDKSVVVITDNGYSDGEYRLFMKSTLISISGRKLDKGLVMKFFVKN